MERSSLIVLLIFSFAMPAAASDGVIDVLSRYTVLETADRMERILKDKGMTIFNRIDHSDGAAKAGITLRATQLLIFGNPKVGSPLMKCRQSVAIDLPQKALIWQDKQDKVWITYNNPRYLEKRHSIAGCEPVLMKIEKALAGIAKAAATQ